LGIATLKQLKELDTKLKPNLITEDNRIWNSPKRIAQTCAVLIGVGFFIFSVLTLFLVAGKFYVLPLIAIGFLVSLGSYFMILFFVERFINSKVNVIYKTIHNLKTQGQSGFNPINDPKDILKQVNKDVIEFADVQKKEIKKLKDKETFRRDFIGNLAHELKTPIFSIQNYVLTLLEGGLEDERVNRMFLEKASKSVDRMVALAEDLDSIARLESGRLTLRMEKFNVLELVKEIIDSLESRAESKNVILKLERPSDIVKTIVEADRNKIGQVLTNLIVNSINYAKEGGGQTNIRFFDMDERILVEVEDSGVGIPKESLGRIFERFYRVDNHRAREQGGTGLGLSICKHIIMDAHQETLNVRSVVDKGTVFSFTLKKA